MKNAIPCLFAVVAATVEDMHSIAVEGQRRDNARDMERVLIGQLRTTLAVLISRMGDIERLLHDAHD